MAKSLKIKDLLNKFTSHKISRDELDFLYHSVNQDYHSDDIYNWLSENWDKSSENITGYDPEEMLQLLKNDISGVYQNYDSDPLIRKLENRLHSLFNTYYKFAAIFIIGSLFTAGLMLILKILPLNNNFNYNELRVPMGSKSVLTLSDGTKIWLNSGSYLKYPAKFKEKNREIFLEGEAFLDVAHDKSKPFQVHTSELSIKVLGTQFNVKSYPDENFIETTLLSGSLLIETKDKNNDPVKLQPNQRVTFSKSTNILSVIENTTDNSASDIKDLIIDEKVNTEIITSWKDDKLVFNRERFEDIAIRLERWYNVQIIIEDSTLKDYRYTGTFEKETLEQALFALKIASSFEYKIDKNNIFIYK